MIVASTMRNDTRRALLLERLAKAWDKRADLSFGELLVGAMDDRALALMTDTEIAESVERFVLLGPGEPGAAGDE